VPASYLPLPRFDAGAVGVASWDAARLGRQEGAQLSIG
jgi:hypothetical protein